jgi:hypothetical protein
MDGTSYMRFTGAARRVAAAARGAGLVVPAFRAPPRVPGADRTLRRRPDGGLTVAVRVHGRPFGAVVADLVAGVVAANDGRVDPAARAALVAAGAAQPAPVEAA